MYRYFISFSYTDNYGYQKFNNSETITDVRIGNFKDIEKIENSIFEDLKIPVNDVKIISFKEFE